MAKEKRIKVRIFGGLHSGKSELWSQLLDKPYTQIFSSYQFESIQNTVGGTPVNMHLELIGNGFYRSSKQLGGDRQIVLYDVTNEASVAEAQQLIAEHCLGNGPNVLLVGTKVNLRDEWNPAAIKKARQLATEANITYGGEISAVDDGDGAKELFEKVILEVLDQRKREEKQFYQLYRRDDPSRPALTELPVCLIDEDKAKADRLAGELREEQQPKCTAEIKKFKEGRTKEKDYKLTPASVKVLSETLTRFQNKIEEANQLIQATPSGAIQLRQAKNDFEKEFFKLRDLYLEHHCLPFKHINSFIEYRYGGLDKLKGRIAKHRKQLDSRLNFSEELDSIQSEIESVEETITNLLISIDREQPSGDVGILKHELEGIQKQLADVLAKIGLLKIESSKVELLLDQLFAEDRQSQMGPARIQECLLQAIRDRNYVEVSNLLNTGANPNRAGVQGTTPLYWAIKNNCPSTVEILLKKGANPNQIATKRGLTPLGLAIYLACGLPTASSIQIIAMLLNSGADLGQEQERDIRDILKGEESCIKDFLDHKQEVPSEHLERVRLLKEAMEKRGLVADAKKAAPKVPADEHPAAPAQGNKQPLKDAKQRQMPQDSGQGQPKVQQSEAAKVKGAESAAVPPAAVVSSRSEAKGDAPKADFAAKKAAVSAGLAEVLQPRDRSASANRSNPVASSSAASVVPPKAPPEGVRLHLGRGQPADRVSVLKSNIVPPQSLVKPGSPRVSSGAVSVVPPKAPPSGVRLDLGGGRPAGAPPQRGIVSSQPSAPGGKPGEVKFGQEGLRKTGNLAQLVKPSDSSDSNVRPK